VAALQLRRHHTLDWIAKKLKKKLQQKKKSTKGRLVLEKRSTEYSAKNMHILLVERLFLVAWGSCSEDYTVWYSMYG